MGGSQSTTSASSAPPPGAAGSANPLAGGGCPVLSPEEITNSPVYNVYNQRVDGQAPAAAKAAPDEQPLFPGMQRLILPTQQLDPKNNMPVEANQRPWHTQTKPISTDRQPSTIPKGGTASTWTYPSPQMFYNALKRKGKGEDVTEDDMQGVVSVHNGMNEATWQHVAVWERLHSKECGDPRLRRFIGRPHDLSPLARALSWTGKQLPFDRHDWYIDRCGEEVRYVIDFYFNEEKAGTIDQFEIIARPAIDSPTAALDRVKMSIYRTCYEYGLPCPISGHPSTVVAGEGGQ